jgi:hypothetical protein
LEGCIGGMQAENLIKGEGLQDRRQGLISGCSGIQTPSFRTAFPESPHTP